MNKLTKILAVVVTCLAIGYFSGTVTRSAIIDWYPTLVKPVLIPRIGFCAGMDTLYIMMGIAAGLVWDRMDSDKEGRKKGINIILQLALNALWSYLFLVCVTPC
jgi:tryptophan-rich sensory protein